MTPFEQVDIDHLNLLVDDTPCFCNCIATLAALASFGHAQ
jgi:hypothetical protein